MCLCQINPCITITITFISALAIFIKAKNSLWKKTHWKSNIISICSCHSKATVWATTSPASRVKKRIKTIRTYTSYEIHDGKSFYLTGHMKLSSIYESSEETGKEKFSTGWVCYPGAVWYKLYL